LQILCERSIFSIGKNNIFHSSGEEPGIKIGRCLFPQKRLFLGSQ
jgi:hypothetical protein